MPDLAGTTTFGALLRRHRLAVGWTQATLAEHAGIAERTIQDLERGAARPRRATIRRLVDALAPSPEVRSALEAVTPTPREHESRTRERETDARPNNLSIQPTALLGREREVAEIRAILGGEGRLVTLTGPGGVGKTRVSVQVAAGVLDDFADGVFRVELASISDPALVPSSIAQVLGVRDLGEGKLLESLRAYLRSRSLLLVLDNFEQIVTAAPVVADLLATSPHLRVLVTSREPLRLRAEREYDVPPLALPDARFVTPAATLSGYAAVALFIERAVAIRADFAITDENATAIAEICARLDGLPLAIELAAARIRLLTPRAMVERLEQRLPLLTGGARDLPTRQQTLRATIDWSYDLLDEDERRLFRRLAVFVGGLTPEAAEAVCGPDGLAIDVLEGLESLASKHLVRRRDEVDGEARFGMLETIREYASERLDESGETPHVRWRHARFYLGVAERAEPELRGAEQRAWLNRLDGALSSPPPECDIVKAVTAWSSMTSRSTATRLMARRLARI